MIEYIAAVYLSQRFVCILIHFLIDCELLRDCLGTDPTRGHRYIVLSIFRSAVALQRRRADCIMRSYVSAKRWFIG